MKCSGYLEILTFRLWRVNDFKPMCAGALTVCLGMCDLRQAFGPTLRTRRSRS